MIEREELITINGRVVKDAHLGITKYGNYYLLAVGNTISYSTDGITFDGSVEVVMRQSWESGVYRPSIVIIDGEIWIYYSYGTVPVGGYRTARVKINMMLP